MGPDRDESDEREPFGPREARDLYLEMTMLGTPLQLGAAADLVRRRWHWIDVYAGFDELKALSPSTVALRVDEDGRRFVTIY
jgi:hypothetical protein